MMDAGSVFHIEKKVEAQDQCGLYQGFGRAYKTIGQHV